MPSPRFPFIIVLAALTSATPGRAQGPSNARRGPTAPPLPAIPFSSGPLSLSITYPSANAAIGTRDSNFIFGQTGNGGSSLTINGYSVPVAPNGGFLAFLPVEGDSIAVYHVVARLGADSAVLDHRVRLPRRFQPTSAFWIDRASIEPAGIRWAEPGELIRVGVRASPGAQLSLVLPGGVTIPLAPDTATLAPAIGPFERAPTRAPQREFTRYSGAFPAGTLGAALPDVTTPRVPQAMAATPDSLAQIVAVYGADTLRELVPLRLALLDPLRRPVVVLDDDTAHLGNTDGAVSGKPLPDGTFEWFFRNGTVAAVSGRSGDHLRLALSRGTSAWVAMGDVAGVLPVGTPQPWSRVALVRLTPAESSITARIALGTRLPFKVEESDRALTVRLYGARADLDWLQYGGTDTLVRRMWWAQSAEDEVTVTFELARPVFGYRSRWQGTDLLFEIRRPPVIDARRPLRGRVIAVDPGHPPVGATGPTGLREAEANLAVSLALQTMLQRAGARVILTRGADTAVGLYERSNLAEREHAELLVSIHNNAFPDGVNPWENAGTSAYYFQPRSARLAILVQQGMLARMGLRNIGIGRGDLALVRPTWMPSVLTEGAFLMIPEQENALRTPAFQERYARGVMEGIEAYLRELATGR